MRPSVELEGLLQTYLAESERPGRDDLSSGVLYNNIAVLFQQLGQFSPAEIEFFQKEVEPILKARCFKCHGGEDKIRGEFRITSRAAVLRGGELGAAVSLDGARSEPGVPATTLPSRSHRIMFSGANSS